MSKDISDFMSGFCCSIYHTRPTVSFTGGRKTGFKELRHVKMANGVKFNLTFSSSSFLVSYILGLKAIFKTQDMSWCIVKQFFQQFLMHNWTSIRLHVVRHSCNFLLKQTNKQKEKRSYESKLAIDENGIIYQITV